MGFCQSAIAVPVRNDAYIKQVIHQTRKFDIFFEHTRRVFKAVVVVICPVFFSKLLEEFSERQIDASCPIREVGKPVVVLSFGIDYFVTCLLEQISLVLPEVIGLLMLAVAFEETRSILLDIVVEEPLGCHCLVVALCNFLVHWVVVRSFTRFIS